MLKKAYVAGGCFWGLEELFRTQPGVVDTEVGYMGGSNDSPTYEDHPGHAEAVEITYDSGKTNFSRLLDYFLRVHNPTTTNRQGNDVGESYRSAIFYQSDEELKQAEEMIELVNTAGIWEAPVTTSLERYERFWPAEEYHQDYLQKNPGGYTCHRLWHEESLL